MKSYVLLISEKCIQNLKKYQKFYFDLFINQNGMKCSHYFNSSVSKCTMLVLFQISYIEGPGSAIIKCET